MYKIDDASFRDPKGYVIHRNNNVFRVINNSYKEEYEHCTKSGLFKKLIDEYIINSEELVAKVLLDKNSPFLKSIIVNKGSKNKVKIGMAVMDGGYLVGKIVELNYSTSRALLISDLNSKIPVIIEPGNVQSILSGTAKEFGEIQYFKEDFSLAEKSVVYTSGSGGIFKVGIPIGIMDQKSLYLNNKVKFFSDLSQLTFINLISFKNLENKSVFCLNDLKFLNKIFSYILRIIENNFI